jgi:hypothetical protein
MQREDIGMEVALEGLEVWPSARYVLFELLAEHRHELDKLALEHPNVSV